MKIDWILEKSIKPQIYLFTCNVLGQSVRPIQLFRAPSFCTWECSWTFLKLGTESDLPVVRSSTKYPPHMSSTEKPTQLDNHPHRSVFSSSLRMTSFPPWLKVINAKTYRKMFQLTNNKRCILKYQETIFHITRWQRFKRQMRLSVGEGNRLLIYKHCGRKY